MFGFTKSLRGRLAAYFALSIVISLLISGFLAGALVQRYLRQKTVADLKFQAEALSKQIETEGLPQRRYIADLEKMYQTRAFIMPYREQALGRLSGRGSRGDEAEPYTRPFPVLDWDYLKDGGTQVAETNLPELESDVVVVAHGFKAGEELAGAIVLAKPIRLLQSWRPLATEFLIAAAASLAVSLLLSILLARRLSRPLHEITMAATAVAAGDYSSELTVRSNDEIGRLADAFRYMTEEVRQAQDQQRQFVINVSHELKTPLTAIAGHAQALQDGVAEDPEAVAKSLEVVVSETGRLSRLIEDLLSLAKFDARQFELKRARVVVADLLAAVVDGLAREAGERGVELTAETGSGANMASTGTGTPSTGTGTPSTGTSVLSFDTDPDRLRQILANLVQNALVHTPAGGRVTLAARQTQTPASDVPRAAAGFIEIEVADTGQGIGPDDLPHVFDRFYRAGTGARDAGLGLGLSISRELARAMGGDITAASTPGQGSRFIVSLPASG